MASSLEAARFTFILDTIDGKNMLHHNQLQSQLPFKVLLRPIEVLTTLA